MITLKRSTNKYSIQTNTKWLHKKQVQVGHWIQTSSYNNYIKNKHKSNVVPKQARTDYIKHKYKSSIQFRQAQKNYNKKQYWLTIKSPKAVKHASDKDFQRNVKTLNLHRNRDNVLLREKHKKRQCELYRRELRYRENRFYFFNRDVKGYYKYCNMV